MSDFYCPICNVRRVSHEGEICSSCQDPYDQVQVPAPAQSPMPQYPNVYPSSSSSPDDSGDAYVPVARSRRRVIGSQSSPSSDYSGNARTVLTSANQVHSSSSQPYIPSAPAQPVVPNPPVPVQSAALQAAPPAMPLSPSSGGGNAGAQASVGNTISPIAEGIVKNVSNGKDQAGAVGRWIRSFIMGIPFARTDDITEFQVYSNWSGTSTGGGFSADKVIAYGNIVTGKPIQDNSVRIYGVRDKNRMIIADTIENTTDGTCSVFDPKPMSAKTVRIITLGIIAIIILLILGISSGLNGSSGAVGAGFQKFIASAICAVIAFFSGKRAASNFGVNWRNCGICALVAVFFAYVAISMLTQSN